MHYYNCTRHPTFLKPSQNDCNISMQHIVTCWAQHVARVWPPCCDVLEHVRCCWLKFENGQIFLEIFVDVAWCCGRLARFVQQCCTRACALVRFATPDMSQHVVTGWLKARNILRPTMLWYGALQCCDRLAGACKYWANNVAICCIEMLRSFGRGLICKIAAELITTQLGVLKKPETNPFVCLT